MASYFSLSDIPNYQALSEEERYQLRLVIYRCESTVCNWHDCPFDDGLLCSCELDSYEAAAEWWRTVAEAWSWQVQ